MEPKEVTIQPPLPTTLILSVCLRPQVFHF